MKVTLKTLYATPKRVVQPDQTVDLPSREARALIKSGAAVKAADDPARKQPARKLEPPSDATTMSDDTTNEPGSTGNDADADWTDDA